jgi:hypothetical protein
MRTINAVVSPWRRTTSGTLKTASQSAGEILEQEHQGEARLVGHHVGEHEAVQGPLDRDSRHEEDDAADHAAKGRVASHEAKPRDEAAALVGKALAPALRHRQNGGCDEQRQRDHDHDGDAPQLLRRVAHPARAPRDQGGEQRHLTAGREPLAPARDARPLVVVGRELGAPGLVRQVDHREGQVQQRRPAEQAGRAGRRSRDEELP